MGARADSWIDKMQRDGNGVEAQFYDRKACDEIAAETTAWGIAVAGLRHACEGARAPSRRAGTNLAIALEVTCNAIVHRVAPKLPRELRTEAVGAEKIDLESGKPLLVGQFTKLLGDRSALHRALRQPPAARGTGSWTPSQGAGHGRRGQESGRAQSPDQSRGCGTGPLGVDGDRLSGGFR